MNFYVMTLFPEMIEQGLNTSIIGRATEKGLLSIKAVDIRTAPLGEMAVVIGSEGRGVREEIMNAAKHQLIIPMNPNCESMNAAIAAAIVMWQMNQ